MNLKNRSAISIIEKKVSVIGLGKSGYAATILAHYLGGKVFASDLGNTTEILYRASQLRQKGIKCETGQHSNQIYNADLWVVSPGIPKEADIIIEAQKYNIPIVGEIEFASWFTETPIIAVTGSNGKTTTVHILAAMCQSDSINGKLAGNMGIPFSEIIIDEIKYPNPNRVYILEISSFQMETTQKFHPKVAIILNITPDHLDRHKSFEKYCAVKEKIFANQTENDFLILNQDDPITRDLGNNCPAKKIYFSMENPLQSGIYIKSEKIIAHLNNYEGEVCGLSSLSPGLCWQTENVLPAVATALLLNISLDFLISFKQSSSVKFLRLK